MGGLQAFPGFNQNPLFRTPSGSHHNCRRGRQAQGARTGNHKYGNPRCQRKAEALSNKQPYCNRNHGNRQNHRYENSADLICQLCYRSLGASRLLHQTDNLGKRRVPSNPVCLHLKISGTVYRGSGQPVAGLFFHRNALPGNG